MKTFNLLPNFLILFLLITSCAGNSTIDNNKIALDDQNKLINYFSTSILSKKFQVVHLGTVIENNKNEIPHALLIKFNAKRNGWWFSKEYTLNNIELLISKFTTEDHHLIIKSAFYDEIKKGFVLDARIDSTTNKKSGNPIDKMAPAYAFKNINLKYSYPKSIVIEKGVVLDFHINFDGISEEKETPEIECRLRIN